MLPERVPSAIEDIAAAVERRAQRARVVGQWTTSELLEAVLQELRRLQGEQEQIRECQAVLNWLATQDAYVMLGDGTVFHGQNWFRDARHAWRRSLETPPSTP
jgi:hypothetical protein